MTPEHQRLIALWKKQLGDEKIEALTKLFESMSGQPPKIDKMRFRADNPHLIDTLDALKQGDQLICEEYERQEDGTSTHYYFLKADALLAIDNDATKTLLDHMADSFNSMVKLYPKHLGKSLGISDIIQNAKNLEHINDDSVLDALYYLTNFRGPIVYNSKSNDFPYADGSEISINEDVIKHGSFEDMFYKFLPTQATPPSKKREEPKKIFVSHHHSDAVALGKLKSSLAPIGFDCFLAHEDINPGEHDLERIEKEIRECDAFIYVSSKKANASAFCQQEIGMAKALEKEIITAMIKNNPPDGFIQHPQAICCQAINDDFHNKIYKRLNEIFSAP